MKLNLSKIVAKTLEQLVVVLTINFDRVVSRFESVDLVVVSLVNTTAASTLEYLPDGNNAETKQYRFIKVDATANTVTIYPYTGQTIMNAASYVLAARYDRIWLTFCKETQDWLPVSP